VRRSTAILVGLGAATTGLTWAALRLAAEPSRIALHLALFIAAGVAWAALVLSLPRLSRGRGQLACILVLSAAIRLVGVGRGPVHSDDVYRYVWDGRVQRAGINPYRFAPEAPPLLPLRDASFARLNHRELPTVYPPVAELAFALAATLPLEPLTAWHLIAAASDLAVLALLLAWLIRRGDDPRRVLVWGLCPLVAVELGPNAHVDGLGVALLVAALFVVEAPRPSAPPAGARKAEGRRARAELAGGGLLGLAAAVKPLPLLLLPALRGRRAALAFGAAAALATLPYLGAGAALGGSVGEYARRWRANDGAFAVLSAGATAALAPTRFGGAVSPGGRVARLITGRDRDAVYPDEAANLLARALSLALCLGAVTLALRAGAPPLVVAEVALGGFLLLSPTLHPWYVIWIIPLLAFGAAPAWVVLAALVPLGYLPIAAFRSSGVWHEAIWPRLVEHGPVWLWLSVSVLRRYSLTRRELTVTS
jgi:hypothetical protein